MFNVFRWRCVKVPLGATPARSQTQSSGAASGAPTVAWPRSAHGGDGQQLAVRWGGASRTWQRARCGSTGGSSTQGMVWDTASPARKRARGTAELP